MPALSVLLIIFSIAVLSNYAIHENISKDLQKTLHFKPHYVKEIETIASSETNFKRGIASYWKARQITSFNNKNLKVYPIFYPKLNPELWTSSNRFWYYRKNSSSPRKLFNFIVLDGKSDTTKFIEFFGKENLELLNSGETYILKTPDFYFDEIDNKAKLLN